MRPTAQWIKTLTCITVLCLSGGWALASSEGGNRFRSDGFTEWRLCYDDRSHPDALFRWGHHISPEELGTITGKGPANNSASGGDFASTAEIILWDEARVRDVSGHWGRNLGSSRGSGQANHLITGGR